ncbi:TerD family protein [Streptomyces goshikiensis]|uniref:TerD family protein n=2 Tax=Streptomyces TaxID=1883 RepID=UPI00093B4D72|nr:MULTISPECIES: TerD family protein [unclassified Streptomyces]OKI41126.1 stress response protein TerZ [Streptomyces sp. CB03578]PJN14074.1 stress response protein TerZ [Streptomyces sp. CB02120-2]
MREISKGANVSLTALSEDAGSVVVSLGWSSASGAGDADVSVLLVGEDGKVRSENDFYFYNNPAAADGSVQLLGKTPTDSGDEDRIGVDLTAVPEEVARIVVAASQYGGTRFGDLDGLRMTVADRSGEPLVGFSIDDASVETAFIFGELYRRGEEWKFRAVGQGYETGLAGLATDFGIAVEESEEPEQPEAAAEPPEPGGAVAPRAAQTTTAGTPGPAGSPAAPQTAQPESGTAGGPAAPGAAEPQAATEGTVSPAAPQAAQATAEAAGPAAPAGRPPGPGAVVPAQARGPRTTRKKVTLPKAPGKSLAENESWRPARLFPVPSLKSDKEREVRATSVLLSVMAQVPEFGRRLTAAFGAPAGRMQTFTEVSLPHGDTPRRPDGVIRVERAGKLWTALVETKTNGNPLRPEQVQQYMDIAARRGYESVITLSNDVALEGTAMVDVKVDGRRKHKVGLWHLSWAEVAHQAQLLIRHEGVGNAAHAWLLQELLAYLQHEQSGCHGFQNMGPAWVPVRNGIEDETLCLGDPRATEVVESWERLIRQVCLRLGGELGQKALPVQRVRRGSDPLSRRAAAAERLCLDGRLSAELRVEGTSSVIAVTADLRTAKIRTSVDVPAPEGSYPLVTVRRLVRLLAEAPADLHVESLVEGENGPRGTLERLRPEPGDLVPRNGAAVTGFRLTLIKGMGNSRGNTESGFIRSVDEAVDRFRQGVVAHLGPLEARAGRRG